FHRTVLVRFTGRRVVASDFTEHSAAERCELIGHCPSSLIEGFLVEAISETEHCEFEMAEIGSFTLQSSDEAVGAFRQLSLTEGRRDEHVEPGLFQCLGA